MNFLAQFAFLIVTPLVFAVPEGFHFQGRLFDATGELIESPAVPMTLQILDHNGECLLFEETHQLDTSESAGHFSVRVGQGAKNTTTAPNFSLPAVLSNATSLNDAQMNCILNTYTPGLNDGRRIRIIVDGEALEPDQRISAAPYSTFANSAQNALTLEGKAANEFIHNDGINVTQPKIQAFFDAADGIGAGDTLRWDGTTWEQFTPGGAAAVTAVSSGNSYMTIINSTSTPQLTIQVGSAANTVAAGDDSRFPSSSCASGNFMRWDGAAWQCESDDDTTYALAVAAGANGLMSGADKNKLDNIEAGAEVNVNADWAAGPGDSQILNKPTIPSNITQLTVGSDSISGNSVNGGTISDFASTGIDDNSISTSLTIDSGGNVGIGTNSPAGMLDVSSTSGAFIPPRMTESQRDNLISPPNGSIVYNTTSNKLNIRENGSWIEIGGSSGASVGDFQVFTNSGTWNKPAGVDPHQMVIVELWGGGGGGGAAANQGGGGGGAYNKLTLWAGDLAASVIVTVGNGGATGVAGGDSSFGTHGSAYGGGASVGDAGGGGGGRLSAGTNGVGENAGDGGQPMSGKGDAEGGKSSNYGGGGGAGSYSGFFGRAGGSSIRGGGGGGSFGTADNSGDGGQTIFGGGGGASPSRTGGSSVYGGAGGNGGVAGGIPGGGGGAGAVGARGEVRIRVVP